MDQNGGMNPSTPVPDTTNQVPAPQYIQPQPATLQPAASIQPEPQLQNQTVIQPQPTNFEMVTPVQQTPVADVVDSPPSQQYVQNQPAQTPLGPAPLPATQVQPTNFEMVTPAQQSAAVVSQSLETYQPYSEPRAQFQSTTDYGVQPPQPQPSNFEMVNQAPVTPTQPLDPLITEDVRPAWQQEIVKDISSGQFSSTPSNQSSTQNAMFPEPSYSQSTEPRYQQADQPQVVNSYEQPIQPFHLSYEASTGDPVVQTPGQLALRTWLPRIIILIVLLGLFGGGGFWAYTYGHKTGYAEGVKATKFANSSQTDNTDSTSQTDNTPELSFDLVEPAYKAETVTGLVGEQLQSSDGFVIDVQDVERNYTPSDTSYTLEPNKELVKVNFLIGNAAATQPKKITNENFTLKGPVSEVITYESKLTNFEGYINSLTLSSGSQARMSVVFVVDVDAAPLTLVWQQPYTLQSEASTVTMSIEITLS